MSHQLENGYTKIANTLLERLSCVPLSGAGFRILFWVLRNSYGYHRKDTRSITVRALSKEIDMAGIGAVHLALQALLDNEILIKNEAGEFSLNKNGLAGVPKTEHLRVFPKRNKSVPKTEHFVPKTEHFVPKTEHPPLPPIRSKENSKENLKETETYPEGFETFWKVYPKKTGKDKAAESWKKRNPPLQTCLGALEWQVRSPQWIKDGGQFIPLPATWLNQGRWKDERLTISTCGSAPIPGKYDGIGEKV